MFELSVSKHPLLRLYIRTELFHIDDTQTSLRFYLWQLNAHKCVSRLTDFLHVDVTGGCIKTWRHIPREHACHARVGVDGGVRGTGGQVTVQHRVRNRRIPLGSKQQHVYCKKLCTTLIHCRGKHVYLEVNITKKKQKLTCPAWPIVASDFWRHRLPVDSPIDQTIHRIILSKAKGNLYQNPLCNNCSKAKQNAHNAYF